MSEENTNTESQNTETQPEAKTDEPIFTPEQQKVVDKLVSTAKWETKQSFAEYDTFKASHESLETIKQEAFEAGKQEATKTLVDQMKETQIVFTAKELGFNDPSDALLYIGDRDEIGYDPENGINQEDITKKLTGIAEKKTWLVSDKTDQNVTSSNIAKAHPKKDSTRVDATEGTDKKELIAAKLRGASK